MGIKFGVSALLFLLGQSASAAVVGYKCNLRILGIDSEVKIEEEFNAEISSGSHGDSGSATFKSKDLKTVATVAVDGKWMILTWSQDGKGILNIVSAIQSPSQESRVLIAYNPANLEEQAALNCEVREASIKL